MSAPRQLTGRLQAIALFARRSVVTTGRVPTCAEVADEFGMSVPAAKNYIATLRNEEHWPVTSSHPTSVATSYREKLEAAQTAVRAMGWTRRR